ncbi:hypothetical protein CEW89_18215 [Celeribacter ethanolicus]|uniref:DUF6455 domain-containing protein n=2 Tax=Celeribacter ethanolicus TaxID=1758178 RepID=A0A291GGX5_9RHOB|nr:hypothetical protein CEW89_18215 [Celeribacter ethanolicus]
MVCFSRDVKRNRSEAVMTGTKGYETHERLMNRMAQTLGVDFEELKQRGQCDEGAMENRVHRCMGCTDPEACEVFLADHEAGAEFAPAYCRNKTDLERLAAR